jgi:ABC-type transport system involved in cytochrome bd biosynthesis fused ATPase/permease subunit
VPSEDKNGQNLPTEFPSTGQIKLQDLCLRYAPMLPLALDHVSLDLKHGAKVGVVGRTGSGKSTLLVALFRLIQPCGGSAIIDGVPIADAGVDAVRRQMSIIPQDPAMFEGTLRMNVDPYGAFTDEQVRDLSCEHRRMACLIMPPGAPGYQSRWFGRNEAVELHCRCLWRGLESRREAAGACCMRRWLLLV